MHLTDIIRSYIAAKCITDSSCPCRWEKVQLCTAQVLCYDTDETLSVKSQRR